MLHGIEPSEERDRRTVGCYYSIVGGVCLILLIYWERLVTGVRAKFSRPQLPHRMTRKWFGWCATVRTGKLKPAPHLLSNRYSRPNRARSRTTCLRLPSATGYRWKCPLRSPIQRVLSQDSITRPSSGIQLQPRGNFDTRISLRSRHYYVQSLDVKPDSCCDDQTISEL